MITAVLAAVSVGVSSVLTLGISSIVADEPAAAATGRAVVAGTDTPARTLIEDSLGALSVAGEVGPVRWSTADPYPFSCATLSAPAALTATAPITTSSGVATVSVDVFGAGLGATAYRELVVGVGDCTGQLDTVTTVSPGFGAESSQVTIDRAGTVRSATLSRVGDIVWFVSSDTSATTSTVAQAVNQAITDAAAGTCVNPTSGIEDRARNLIAGAKYVPYQRSAIASINSPGLPTVNSSTVEPVPLDAPLPALPPVTPEKQPTWPVWPDMPAAVPMPTLAQPAPEPVLSGTYTELLLDTDGPGCGWAFTGTASSNEDGDSIKAANAAASDGIKTTLKKQAADWKAQVLEFWSAWPQYQKDAAAYSAYAAQVEETNAAWRVINAEWKTYLAEVDDFNADMKAHKALVASIETAKTDYAAALVACETRPEPTPAATKSPTPPPTPSNGKPSATPTALSTDDPRTEVDESAVDEFGEALDAVDKAAECLEEVPRPKLLDTTVPAAPLHPVEPGNPRPAGQ